MTPAEVLRAARERITAPERWTQHAFARDKDGSSWPPLASNACAWCALGAIRVGANAVGFGAEKAACVALEIAIGETEIDEWNDRDTTTHADVLAAFDLAIELAEREGA